MKNYRLYQVDSFTKNLFQGNPAGVVPNADGPLGAYLVQHRLVPNYGRRFAFKGQQGEAIGRLGTVEVAVEIAEGRPKAVQVGGRAVTVFKSEITL